MHGRRDSLLGVCVSLLVSGVLTLAPAAPAATTAPLFEQVGTLDRFGTDARKAAGAQFVPVWENASTFQRNRLGTIILLPKVRQLWQIYSTEINSVQQTAIVVRDLDTLGVARTLRLDDGVSRATAESNGGEWTHAIDDTGTRLFLLSINQLYVHEFDLRTFASKRWPLPFSSIFVHPLRVGGMSYDPFRNELVVLSGGPGGGSITSVNTYVYRLNLRGMPATTAPPTEVEQVYRIRSCTGPVTSTDVGDDTLNWAILVTEDYLFVPCQRAGHTVIVVRMARPEGNDPDHIEEVAAGPVYGENVQADPASGRLFVATYIGQEIWVFEAATMAFVGAVATGPQGTQAATGYGLDSATGQVFFQSPHFGLGVVEGRFFPIPQARTDPEKKVTGQERIWADAATNRVFVLEGDAVSQTKGRVYRIYRTGPAPVPPAAPDPDRNTADVDEREGITEARFNASGSGYGTRILWAKGYATVAPAPTVGVVAPTFLVFDQFRDRCGYVDRDLFLGRVAKAEYDTGSTAAAAIAVDTDSATRQDLNKPSRCRLDQLEDPNRWAYEPAACATSEGDKARDATGAGRGVLSNPGTSSVRCPEPGSTLEAAAHATLTGEELEVNDAWTTTRIERRPEGVRSTVESVARGVTLGDVLSIGEIRSKAVSTSNGRPRRKDMSTHEIAISHVVFEGTKLCDPRCDPVQLEQDLNLLAGGRAVFRTGHGANSGRDEALVEGSPRGAQTAVQKSTARQASDRALVGDFTVEIPAFEMTVFNDNASWGRARQVYQFAGVATSATYNVVLRPVFGPLPEDPGLPEDLAIGEPTPFASLVETLDEEEGAGTALSAVSAVREDDDGSGGLVEAARAVARGLRLLLTDPRTALLLLTAWALLGSPAVLSRRRRLLAGVQTD